MATLRIRYLVSVVILMTRWAVFFMCGSFDYGMHACTKPYLYNNYICVSFHNSIFLQESRSVPTRGAIQDSNLHKQALHGAKRRRKK